jgi:hypothetical protein
MKALNIFIRRNSLPKSLRSKVWKKILFFFCCVASVVIGLLLCAYFFIFYEHGYAVNIKNKVYVHIEKGEEIISIADIFSPDEAYESICILAGQGDMDYRFYIDKLLSSGYITSIQYNSIPDLFPYADYGVIFILNKEQGSSIIPMRRNGFIAKGRLDKPDFFSFRFDEELLTTQSKNYGCVSFKDAIFKMYASKNPYYILLSSKY